VRARKGSSGKI
jgi:hypothetical protein